jgi:hypothetical protein
LSLLWIASLDAPLDFNVPGLGERTAGWRLRLAGYIPAALLGGHIQNLMAERLLRFDYSIHCDSLDAPTSFSICAPCRAVRRFTSPFRQQSSRYDKRSTQYHWSG